MIRLIAATIAALVLSPASTATCQSFCVNSTCFGPGSCVSGCLCIQPGGPGTQGFCNSAG